MCCSIFNRFQAIVMANWLDHKCSFFPFEAGRYFQIWECTKYALRCGTGQSFSSPLLLFYSKMCCDEECQSDGTLNYVELAGSEYTKNSFLSINILAICFFDPVFLSLWEGCFFPAIHPPRRQQDKLHQEFYNVPTKVPNNPKVSSWGKVSTRGDGKTPFQNIGIVEFLRKKSWSKKTFQNVEVGEILHDSLRQVEANLYQKMPNWSQRKLFLLEVRFKFHPLASPEKQMRE